MSAAYSGPRQSTTDPNNEEPAPSGVQTSLLPRHESQDAIRKRHSVVADKSARDGALEANTGPCQTSRGVDKWRRCWRPISTWWQEALAIVLLLGSLIASFATLYPYQGKPIPEWPYSITIGALLSIYSVILRLAATFLLSQGFAQSKWQWFNSGARPLHDMVLHDNASRGPMGAFGLLYRLAVPMTWQWLGCILAIVALLVGPFTQQVLQYETCAVDLGAEAFITRVSAFMTLDKASENYLLSNVLVRQQQAAIIAGLYSPGAVGYSCSSGNCTFAPYTTVGYCSSCEDLSSNVAATIVETTDTWPEPTSTLQNSVRLPVKDDWLFGELRNRTIEVHWVSKIGSWGAVGGNDQVMATGTVTGHAEVSGIRYVVLVGHAEYDSGAGTIGTSTECASVASEYSWRCQGYGAASCSIVPCLRTYNATVTNGLLHEQLIGLETEALESSFGYWLDSTTPVNAALNLSCISENDRAILRNRSYDLDFEGPWRGTWLPYNLTEDPWITDHEFDRESIDALERGFIDQGCLYVVPETFSWKLQKFMNLSLHEDLQGRENFQEASRMMKSTTGSQILEFIWNNGEFSFERTRSIFDNMTLSLTNHLRMNPGEDWRTKQVRKSGLKPNATEANDGNYTDASGLYFPARGQAWTTRTCARVRWPWLILPAIITMLTLVFYTGILLGARALPKDVQTWKTSPLPFMFYGPGGTEESQRQEWFKATSQHVDDMDAAARKIHLRLDRDEAGMAFFRKRGAVVDVERTSLTSGSDAVL